MASRAQSEFASPPQHIGLLFIGRRLHVSDRCISAQELARYQRRSAERDLSDLVWSCCRRYLYAHHLIQPEMRVPGKLEAGRGADLTELLLPWDQLCRRYRKIVFDAQIDLFEQQQERELTRWHRFKEGKVVDRILDCSERTRTVLETVGLLDPLPRYDPMTVERLFQHVI